MFKEFLNYYDRVFDQNGNIKPCGRFACQKLIELSDKIEPGIIHGDIKTGMMKVKKIKDLYIRTLNIK